MKRRPLNIRELRTCQAEADQPEEEEEDFSLLGFWQRRTTSTACTSTGGAEAEMPHLALLARLFHGIESTSCQAEKDFSAISNMIGTLRSSMLPDKVERSMMFLRLNRRFIPEVRALNDAKEAKKRAAAMIIAKEVARMQEAVEGTEVELVL